MTEVSFKKDEIIFREGEQGSVMYLIVTGRVGIYVGYGTEKKTQLTVMGSGAVLGEMAVVEEAPRSATALARARLSWAFTSRTAERSLVCVPEFSHAATAIVMMIRKIASTIIISTMV